MDLVQKQNSKKIMRVAWIAPNGGNFTLSRLKGTGGWISSMESALLESNEDVELGLVFAHSENLQPMTKGRVTYYPVYRPLENNIQKLYHRWFRDEDKYEDTLVAQMVEYIDQFKPDIVHVWGCENFYVKVLKYINYPSVVHIQGFASSIVPHYLPNGVGIADISSQDNSLDRYIFKRGNLHDYKTLLRRVSNEKDAAKYITNWIGRTAWDKANAYCLAPNANYHHCDELMRKEFYEHQWHYHYDGKIVIQSSISNAWYKGIDIVLRTAQTLTSLGVNFEWNIYGVTENTSVVRYFSRKYNVLPKDLNIHLYGYVDGNTIMQGLLNSDVYVHPSHIENSSNAIAEAMMLGVPVVAQYIGGTPTMLKEGSGLLVQPNDAPAMAYSILQMRDRNIAEGYSDRSRDVAIKRHNKEKVVVDLVSAYKSIING